MRILQIVPTYLPATRYGGPIFSVHGLARALAARGHRVEVFTTNIDGPLKHAVVPGEPVELDGVSVRYFDCEHLRRLYWAPELARTLSTQISEFDVVHLNSVFLWPTWAAARKARAARVPYVVSPRGMLVKELIRRRSRVAKSAWIGLIERSNLERASAIHATSELEASDLQQFGWRLPFVARIPNGVNEPETRNESPSADVARVLGAGGPIVLFLGRLSWKKGLDRLLRAFVGVNGATLAIVGTDDEGLSSQFQQRVTALGIANRVCIIPRTVLGNDKEHLFAAAAAFVLPSLSENFGNTVLEAMCRAVPVIVTESVGAAEIVRSAGAGLVVEGSSESIGAAINRLVHDKKLAGTMGEAGRRYALANCCWDSVAAQMEELYRRIVN